jgi:hypothetical protein
MFASCKSRIYGVCAALPLLILAAGCGISPANGGGGFAISASETTIATTGQLQFKATQLDGSPAAVNWSVNSTQNSASLGAGSIDASGLYTPPNALSSNSIDVNVMAHLQNDPSRMATETITVTPGFLQPLLPEDASVSQGGTLEISAQIAEVNGGTVHWSLSDNAMGTLSQSICQRGNLQYTTCKVSYTAPSALSTQSVRVIATVNDTNTQSKVHLLLNSNGVNSSALANQAAQTGLISLGASGSNDGDYDVYKDASGESYIADCCGGTLGALVEDTEHNQYILSNNHVLAESDQGRIGDTIDQPGLIDDGCHPLSQQGATVRSAGTLRYYVPLATIQSNVDAALAAVSPGTVNPDGSILQLGEPSMGASLGAAPPVGGNGETLNAANLNGLRVVKSGRTTGLTCSTVESINLAVKVDYYKDCAETQPYYTKMFTGQIGIAGNSFSDSGDSGSLILDAANAQAVGLFYAGGTDGDGNGLSVANPIADVLTELGNQAGSKLSIVGSKTGHALTCLNYDNNTESAAAALPDLSQAAEAQARNAAQNAAAELLNHEKGILGVVAGKSADSPGEAAVIVYVDKTKSNIAVPQTIAGARTAVILTDARSIANGTAPKLPANSAGIQLTANTLSNAAAVERQYAPQLFADPAIFGVGVAQSRDNPQEAALLVLVDMNKAARTMPATLGGLRVRYMQLHRFHVTKSKYAGAHPVSSCALKSLKPVVLH